MSQSIFPTLITNTFIPSLWRFPSGQITAEYLNTNFLKFPISQGSETILGGLTIGGANNITLGSGATAPTAGQLGFNRNATSTSATLTTGGAAQTLSTISSVGVGVYIITFAVFNGGFAGTVYVDAFVEINGVNISQTSGIGVVGVSNFALNGSIVFVNTSVQNFLLRGAITSGGTITSLDFNFNVLRIA